MAGECEMCGGWRGILLPCDSVCVCVCVVCVCVCCVCVCVVCVCVCDMLLMS